MHGERCRGHVSVLVALVVTALAIPAWPVVGLAAGGCTAVLQYSTGIVQCYPPSQAAVAARRLPVPPVDPVTAVWRVTHLRLGQVITLAIAPRSRQVGRPRVIALSYVFGPLSVFRESIPDPPPAHPKFVVLGEMEGHSPWTGVHITRSRETSNTGPGGELVTRYSSWDVAAAVPGRKLFIHVISNESYAVLIKVIERVLARSFRCAAPETANGLQVIQCSYLKTRAHVARGDSVDRRPQSHRAGMSVLRTVHVGQHPVALAVDARIGRVVVVNQGSLYPNGSGTATGHGSVSMLDATTGRLLRTTPVGQNPRAVAIDEQTRRVFVVDEGPLSPNHSNLPTAHGAVSVLAARSGRTLRSYEVDTTPSGYPAVVAVDDRLHHAFAATGSTLSMLDTRSGRIQHMVRTRPLDAAAVDVSTAQAFAAGLTLPTNRGLVYVIDGRTGCILRTIGVGTGPSALAVDTRSGHLFVANRDDNTISVISVTT